MIYPFRFNIGDHVRICDTTEWKEHRGLTGHVKALELSAAKTTAVVQPDKDGRPVRVHEDSLRSIS